MDSRERDKFYSSDPDIGDDDEYELEPPDAEVTAAAERRGRETIEATHATIDIDEIYRDASRERSEEILQGWIRDFKFRFQFQVKHLLIATAVLAIALTLYKLQVFYTALIVLFMLSVAGLYLYLQWQEQKAQEEATRRRHEMYARRRAHFERTQGGVGGSDIAEPLPEKLPASGGRASTPTNDTEWQDATASKPIRFRFSMAELLIAITTASIVFGCVQFLGGASNAATLLGLIALAGLVVHALGFEPPEIIILGWWLVLVLYVMLSLAAAMWSGIN